MEALQLDFFRTPEECEIIQLRGQIKDIEISTGKVRRALFARHGELAKITLDLENRLQILERNICKGVIYE